MACPFPKPNAIIDEPIILSQRSTTERFKISRAVMQQTCWKIVNMQRGGKADVVVMFFYKSHLMTLAF